MADNVSTKNQVKEITDRLEQGVKELFESEKYMAYLKTMSRFTRYSTRNTLLIHMQKPDATLVAGYQAWQSKFGRYVKKGEKGIKILAPTPFVIREERQKLDPDTKIPVLGEDGLPLTELVEKRLARFKVIPVFDVSQTDGKPLPVLAEDLTGDVRRYELFMDALRAVSPLPIGFEPLEPGTDGECRMGKNIAIREGMSEIQTVSAVIHEITHAKLHDLELLRQQDETAEPKDRRTEEVEAESVSYAVCQYYGIETGANSFGYLADWSKSRELKELNASLETIRKTAAELIEGIDKQFLALAKERGIDLTAELPARELSPEQTSPQKEPEPSAEPALASDLKPNQHIETIGGVEFVFTGVGPAPKPSPIQEADKFIDDIGGIGNLFGAPTPAPKPELKPEKQYDLGFGHMGNGLTVWNRLEEKDGDYVTVAHIAPDRNVTFYDKDIPEGIKARIEDVARTSDMSISATQDAPVFDTPPQGAEQEMTAVEAAALAQEGERALRDIGEESLEPPAPSDVGGNAYQDIDEPDCGIMPDPSIGLSERDLFGYNGADILPLTQARALELFDQNMTIYMLHPDNTEAMAFEREEITAHDGIFGIDAAEWQQSPEYKRLEAEQSEGTREATLLYGEKNAFGIYQLKNGDELHYHRFTSLEQLEKDGLTVDRDNYELVYTGQLDIRDRLTNLGKIYETFNVDRPADFTGHSVSVSDVIVLQWRGEVTSHYVDSASFKELPAFLGCEGQPQAERGTSPQVGNMLPTDGPTVAELKAEVDAGGQISLSALANAVKNERQQSTRKERPSLLAQLQEYKNGATQGADSPKTAPKHDAQREV